MVALAVAAALIAVDSGEIVQEAGIFRRFVATQPHLRTTRILNTKTGDVLSPSPDTPEFVVETVAGERLTTDDFSVASTAPDRIVLKSIKTPARQIVVELLTTGGDTLGRRLTLEGFSDVRRLVVDAMKVDVRAELGGLGQPLFISGKWFAGLEHPAGINRYDVRTGYVELYQHPTKTQSMPAVLGGVTSETDNLDDAFARYLNAIRRRPPRPMLQYNTWFDLRGDDLTPKAVRAAADEIHRKLSSYRLAPATVVVDDGWQDPRSLWQPRGPWASGFNDLSKTLHTNAMSLGLWLPLNGASLDTSVGRAKGYLQSDHRKGYYCLHSPQYRADLSNVLRTYRDQGVAFFKHDFNFLACAASGHGHQATPEHGREANVDGQLELIDALNVPSAVTSNAWPSPYWLKHTDYLWIGSFDYAEDWSVPCWTRRQAEMTFRDAQIHRLLRIDRAQVPMNALMTHGLIRGRYEGAAADRDLDDWADYVMMFLGRGVMLQELYLTPSLLSDAEWKILGAALQWANARADVLKHTRMIGGRPDAGEVYGYVHWSPDFGVLCLRNPSPRPGEFTLPETARPTTGGSRKWSSWKIYPTRRRLADSVSDQPWRLSLAGHEVAIIEFDGISARRSSFDALRPSSPLTVQRNEPDRLDWRLEATAPPGTSMELCWWTEPAFGAAASAKAVETATPRSELPDADWSLHRSPLGGRESATMSLKLPWSPFWPQETRASAVVRTIRRRSNLNAAGPEVATSLPEIRPSHHDVEFEETLVLDEWRFHRRRSWPEKLAWVLALGVLPIALTTTAAQRIGSKWKWPRLVGLIAVAVLVGLYTVTPLGVALGRVLGEF